MNTQYTVESLEGKQMKNVSTSLHSTTQTVVFYLYKQCKIKQDRQDQICTIQSRVMTPQKFNGFCLWTENLLKNPTNFSSTHVHLSCHRTKMSSKLNKMSGNENKIAEGEWGRDETTKPIRRHIVPTSFVLHCLKSISIEQWNEIFLDFYNKELGQILLYI